MQTTEYFELNIVEGSDLVNPLTQQNPNFEKIDEQMFKNQNSGVCLATELKTASVHAINRTVPDCAMFRFTATSDFLSGDTFTVDGVQVTAKLTNGQPLGTGAFVINSEVIGVLVGTLVTFYVESGVVPTASDSERLGGELPSYYAKKTEVDQAQDLAEASATLGQQNQQAINEVIGKSLKLLWENPNPTIEFGPQDITLSSADYDYLIFEFINGAGANRGTELVFKGSDVYLNIVGGTGSGSTARVVSLERQISRVTDTRFSVNNCAQVLQGSSGLTNDSLKPYKIYGGKF